MKKISVFILFVMLLAATLKGQNQIASYEYWFNNDYANAIQVSVTPAQKINLKQNIDASSLANGVHVFNIRFLDTAQRWSSVVSQFFYKAPQSSTQNHEIVSYEYWFNNDYANAVSRIATGQVFTLDSLLDASSISLGVHTFNIRFKDNSGLWSSVASQFFYKAPQSTVAQTEIIEYEYWFDNDYAASQKFSVANQQSFLLSDKLNASSVSDGLHVLSIRFRDNQGLWSSAISQFFYKIPVKEVSDNKIVAYKYWFDNDLEGTSFVSVNPQQKHFNLNDKISLIEIPKGRYSINFQFQDSMGLWSSVVSDSIEKQSLPIARFEVVEQNHCDSVEVTFINKSIDADTYEWDFGDGNNST